MDQVQEHSNHNIKLLSSCPTFQIPRQLPVASEATRNTKLLPANSRTLTNNKVSRSFCYALIQEIATKYGAKLPNARAASPKMEADEILISMFLCCNQLNIYYSCWRFFFVLANEIEDRWRKSEGKYVSFHRNS